MLNSSGADGVQKRPEVALIHLKLEGNEPVCSRFEVALSLTFSSSLLTANPQTAPGGV